jgi:osmotically-inducible protein OsmY
MSDDLKLQQHVVDELAFEPRVNAAHIGVSVRNGVVALNGRVDTYAEKHAAARAVRRVKGVKAVADDIEVHLPSDRKTADDEIAARALDLLAWDVAVPDDAIKLKVEHGVITLSGEVEWAYQRAEAEYDVRKLGGVKAVINDIRVRPQASPGAVLEHIRRAFERSAELEASGITVAVTGGKVVLGGKVRNWIEREEAERAAWSAPGVTAVEDRIELVRPS